MAEKILMIALSPTMDEGAITGWKVKEGDRIKSGDVLCEVETDKAAMEYESPVAGTVLKIVRTVGESVRVGDLIAVVGKEGEEIAALLGRAATPGSRQPVEVPAATGAPEPRAAAGGSSSGAPSRSAGRAAAASPLARRLAAEMGIDISGVKGSGPGGRIVKRDLQAARKAEAASVAEATGEKARGVEPAFARPPAAPADRSVPVSRMRAVIAKRLVESVTQAPHFFLRVAVGVDRLLELRAGVNEGRQAKLSLNAFLIKFAAEAIKRHPVINASWKGDTIEYKGSVDVGLAVALPEGLITPVVRNCGNKGVAAIDAELGPLVEKARSGGLGPEEYSGATFTISNLGSYGIEEFTAIINPPGSAILAVGASVKEAVVGDDDEVSIKKVMRLTLSCDHRVIDGAAGALFLSDLKVIIEEPGRALV